MFVPPSTGNIIGLLGGTKFANILQESVQHSGSVSGYQCKGIGIETTEMTLPVTASTGQLRPETENAWSGFV